MSRRLRFTNANHCTEERLGENPNAFGFSCSKDPISDQPECVVSTSTEPEYSYSMTGCQQCANECTYNTEGDYDDNNSENSENSDEHTKKGTDSFLIFLFIFLPIVAVLAIVVGVIYLYLHPQPKMF